MCLLWLALPCLAFPCPALACLALDLHPRSSILCTLVLFPLAGAPWRPRRLSQMYQNPVYDSLAGVSIAVLLGVIGLGLTEVSRADLHQRRALSWRALLQLAPGYR